MALLFLDGVEHYTTAGMLTKWTGLYSGPIVSTVEARTGLQSIRCDDGGTSGDGVFKTFSSSYATLIVGFGFYYTGSPQYGKQYICAIEKASEGIQIDLRIDTSTGVIHVTRNGTVLGSSLEQISQGQWYYIELKAYIHNSAGTVDVQLNGVSVISLTGQDTQAQASANADIVRFHQFHSKTVTYFDDIYICDDSGALNNDFLGDIQVETIMPNAVGSSSQWTPLGGGNNYLEVDEAQPDDDTSYVSDSTVGNKDTYGMGDLVVTTGTIKGIQVGLYARKDSAGTRQIAPVVRSGATEQDGASWAIGASYGLNLQAFETDPATGVAWTIAGINAMEAGVKVTG